MSRFLNTRGRASFAIGICDRCSRKFPIDELRSDVNAPGLRVCAADFDDLDPYRLPPHQPEILPLRFARPDVSIAIDANGNPVSSGPS